MAGRDYVVPEDVREQFGYVAGHRIAVDAGLEHSGKGQVIDEIINNIKLPFV